MFALAFVIATLAWPEPAQKGETVAPVAGSPHCVRVLQTRGTVHDIDIAPDGKRIVIGVETGHAYVHVLETGALEADLFVSAGPAWDVEFDPTGTRILVLQPNATRIWNAKTFELERALEGQKLGMFRACFSPDGKLVATGSMGDTKSPDADAEARVWEVANGAVVAVVHDQTYRVLPSFRPDGKALLVSSQSSGVLSIMDLDESHSIRQLGDRAGGVAWSAWSPDGKTVLSVTVDNLGRLWKAESGRELFVLRGHTGYPVWCGFSPDGKEVSTTSWVDRTTRIWNVTTGKERLVLKGHTDRPIMTQFAPDGRALVSVDAVGVGLVYELRQGALAAKYEGHAGIISALDITHDSKLVVTGAHDGAVRVWKNPVAK